MDTKALQEKYRFNKKRWVGPYYYNYPDGEDLVGKLSFCGQVAFFVSVPFGITNAYMDYPYVTSHVGKLYKIAKTVVPAVGMGLAFAAATYYATKIRQKDDPWNHAIGGAAAGAILGASTKLANGLIGGIYFAAAAAIIKHTGDYRPLVQRDFSPYLKRMTDLSNTPYKQGNWVKGPAPEA